MDDLITFLRARLDEDDEVALATRRNEQFVEGTDRWFASHGNAITSMAPHRAVAQVDRDRQLVALAEYFLQWTDGHDAGVTQHEIGTMRTAGKEILRRIALPYARHREYRKEWRP